MTNEKYSNAGWASIMAAVIFPLAYIIEGVQEIFMSSYFEERIIGIGLSDILFLCFACLAIYTYTSFKRFMFDNYSFKGANTIINILIFMHMLYYGVSFIVELFVVPIFSTLGIEPSFIFVSFWMIGLFIYGVLDIILAAILISKMSRFPTKIKVFAAFSLVMGIIELTIILAPLNILFVPAVFISLAIIFLQKEDSVEFV